jgi:4-amino-4-deoxy-L-arabinose transferase-like glycosyltransferase
MLRYLDLWFEPVSASQDYSKRHRAALVLTLVLGAWLRFWHLGDVGLHGDEDIMALAARGIVAHGVPVLPSDMTYWRAPLHTYLLAGTVMLFGETEWALRLPSAVVGSLCGLLAFAAGRRFLNPLENLAFVATVTFLPALIEMSQTARMYIFLVAGVLGFCIMLFRWETSGSISDYLWALFLLMITIQFHRLAVFAAPMLLFPGVANRSWKQVCQAIPGIVGSVLVSAMTAKLAHLDFPEESERLPEDDAVESSGLESVDSGLDIALMLPALIVGAVVMAILLGGAVKWRDRLLPVALLAAGAAACTLLQYHAGAILLMVGSILWLRRGGGGVRLLAVAAVLAINAGLQFIELRATGAYRGAQIIGAMVGTPSILPMLRFAEFSYAGSAFVIVAFLFAATRLSRGAAIPLYFLFLLISVWIPLVAIGMFAWNVPSRYVSGPLPFFLLGSIACAVYLVGMIVRGDSYSVLRGAKPVAATVVTAACVINPVSAWNIARSGYEIHPDHKGAALFLQRVAISADDVVIAEDSIVQSFYLGNMVDYRLQSLVGARAHATFDGTNAYDQYSGAVVVGSGPDLMRVLETNKDRRVFIVSSAQVSESLSRRNRGDGIAEILGSGRLKVLYVGRDGATTVWGNHQLLRGN